MRQPLPLPSQDYLRECFDYDPESGRLTWRARPRQHFMTNRAHSVFNARHAGAAVGRISTDGGIDIGVSHRRYKAARVIYKLMTGREPIVMDHRDRDRLNNRWDNLRDTTETKNNANTGVRRHNVLGVKGVIRIRTGFRARITVDKKSVHLGVFATPEAAHAAYRAAAQARGKESH